MTTLGGTLAGEASPGTRRRAAFLPLYAGTIFLSAFLLFGVQPMFTKMVLPVLGGSPSVWSVAMVFFQALLLAGYAYAHALARYAPPRLAAPLHLAVMAGALLTMPIGLAAGWGRPPGDGEAAWLLGLFLVSVGLPFFALAANGPLLQTWFARSDHPHAGDPYFLYGASNIGSFAALLAYPLAIEPFLPLAAQSRSWMAGFAALACLIAACAVVAAGRTAAASRPITEATRAAGHGGVWRERLGWVLLSLVPSGLLISVTAHISTDVAAAPLLWVAPLALFLLTFVLAFRDRPILSGDALARLQVWGAALALILWNGSSWMAVGIAVHLGLFFVNAMICHGALYRRRPPAARLTEFYLCLSLGGVVGGILCGLVAPQVFATVLEYPLLLIVALACRPGFLDLDRARVRSGLRVGAAIVILVFLGDLAAETLVPAGWIQAGLLAILCAGTMAVWRKPEHVAPFALSAFLIAALMNGAVGAGTSRSFFGVHKVRVSADGRFRLLSHGTTLHGAMRILNEDGTPATDRPEPTTYYGLEGGIGTAIRAVRDARGGGLGAVAAIGLGTGSLACHAADREDWTFLEIDPEVVRIARDPALFRFLSVCAPDTRIVLGDARLTLADEPAGKGLIVVDAFSSDAIPTHLMTREALALYLAKLDATGALVVHISNRHLELRHILARVAAEQGLVLYLRFDRVRESGETRYRAPSIVAAIARDPGHLGALAAEGGWTRIDPDMTRRPWSDDFTNVIEAMIDRARP